MSAFVDLSKPFSYENKGGHDCCVVCIPSMLSRYGKPKALQRFPI